MLAPECSAPVDPACTPDFVPVSPADGVSPLTDARGENRGQP